MAGKWGVDGLVRIGTNAVAEIQNWEVEESVDPIVDTSMGDTAETHIIGSGISSWTCTATCLWDETDTNGQQACSLKASVTLNLHPEGNASGDLYYTGTASVVRRGVAVPKDNVITRVIEFRGNGPLSEATV